MSTTEPAAPLEADSQLPPVEPPNIGFIVKLFVIPAVIVSSMIVVWILINWLANMGSDPRVYVEALKRDNAVKWQAAHNLANELQRPAGQKMRQDPLVAQEIGGILLEEMLRKDRPQTGDALKESLKYCVYLCHVLGRFEVVEALPALLTAAEPERQPAEGVVRCAALHALAVWIAQAQTVNPDLLNATTRAQLLKVLLKASEQDQVYLVREYAAYGLGVLGGEQAEARLTTLLDSASANIRFNAATGLARYGNGAAQEVLEEMVDFENLSHIELDQQTESPEFTEALRAELDVGRAPTTPADEQTVLDNQVVAKEQKRAIVMLNGLRAYESLCVKNPAISRTALLAAAKKLSEQEKVPTHVQSEARNLLRRLSPNAE